MFYLLLLRFVEVKDERAGSTDSCLQMFAPEPIQRNGAEVLQEFSARRVKFKPPLR